MDHRDSSENLPEKTTRSISFTVVLFLLALTSIAAAEVKTLAREFVYQAGTLDNRTTARAVALEGVKERLWKGLWNELEENVQVKNLQLSPEQIAAFVPVLAAFRVTDEKWAGRVFRIDAELTVDPDELPGMLRALMKDGEKTRELIEHRKKREENLREMVLLKSAAPAAGEGRARGKASARYAALAGSLTMTDWMIRGFHAEIQGDWKQSKWAFGQALKRDGKNVTALYHRGLASLRLGQRAQAFQDLTGAVRLDPEYSLAWFLRGVIQVQEKRDRRAIDDFSKAIGTNNHYSPAYFQRGLALERMGRRPEAVRDLSKAIELTPGDAEAYLNRGVIYSKLGDTEKAERDLATAVRLDQQHDLMTGLPETPLAGAGQGPQSIKELDSLIARDPGNANAYFRRGVAYDNLGHHQEALQDLNKAIELNPKNAAAYFMRGLVYGMIDVSYASINDIKVSARLGYKPAQDYMNAMGTPW